MPQNHGRVLLVDDDQGVRETAHSLIETLGWTVEAHADGDSALALIRASDTDFDVALVDVTMPGRSGLDTAEELRRAAPGLRIVIMSGLLEDDVERCIAAGHADEFLQKPFRVADLRRVLDKAGTRPDEPAG